MTTRVNHRRRLQNCHLRNNRLRLPHHCVVVVVVVVVVVAAAAAVFVFFCYFSFFFDCFFPFLLIF